MSNLTYKIFSAQGAEKSIAQYSQLLSRNTNISNVSVEKVTKTKLQEKITAALSNIFVKADASLSKGNIFEVLGFAEHSLAYNVGDTKKESLYLTLKVYRDESDTTGTEKLISLQRLITNLIIVSDNWVTDSGDNVNELANEFLADSDIVLTDDMPAQDRLALFLTGKRIKVQDVKRFRYRSSRTGTEFNNTLYNFKYV